MSDETDIINQQGAYGLAMKTPYPNPMNIYQGAITELTNPARELYELELSLKGKYIDAEGKEHELGERLCNDKGVSAILRMAKATVSQVSFMSNYDETMIPKLILYLAKTLIRDLMFNKDKYEIVDDRARHTITYITCVASNAACRRALENGERRFWKGSQQETTIRTENSQSNKGKGFWKSILPGSK
jgi:hypothetical protein